MKRAEFLCVAAISSDSCDLGLVELLQVSEMSTGVQPYESLLKPSVFEILKMVHYFSS